MKEAYERGKVDALEMWGRVCGKQSNCEQCAIGAIKDAGISCQDFARKFPSKFLSLLTEMDDGMVSYYEEYCYRFPDCNLSVEDLAQIACRKALFEGDCSCGGPESACVECWKQQYVSDVEPE